MNPIVDFPEIRAITFAFDVRSARHRAGDG
ncbi:hypothetical protein MMUC44124_05735 [Mycolicibacterium mucogenicum DSM 44124]|nr:hypothetical protein MMUC44124_05735 [Mycolicibacterium mucogenicum DSM 44124]